MFTERDAPFYQFAYPLSFPPLNDGFVDYMIDGVEPALKEKLNRPAAIEHFHRFDRNPLLFKYGLAENLIQPNANEEELDNIVLEEASERFGYETRWNGLRPTQRAIARLAADRKLRLRSKGPELVFETPIDVVSFTEAEGIDEANELIERKILDRWNGEWTVADSLFKAWIMN